MRLLLDHHYSPLIADALRKGGFDVMTARELDWHEEDDESLLMLCHGERRVLLTKNVADFVVIARQWQAEGRSHSGLVLTADSSMPRSRNGIGRYVEALTELLQTHSESAAFVDRIHWL